MKKIVTIVFAVILLLAVCFSMVGCIPTTEKGIIRKMENAGYTHKVSTDEVEIKQMCEIFMFSGLVKVVFFESTDEEKGTMTLFCFSSKKEAKTGYEKIKERAERLSQPNTAQGLVGKFVYGGAVEATRTLRG